MYKLKYNHIPKEWINGLPVGNGRLAAMYWGNDKNDILSLNHEYLWRGKNRGKEADKVADKLPMLRELLKKKDYFRATLFANLFWGGLGGDSGTVPGRIDSYQPAGNLLFEYTDAVSGEKCELNIDNAIVFSKRNNNVNFDAFCDSNDGLILTKWSCQTGFSGKLYFERTDDPEAEYTTKYCTDGIEFNCRFVCGINYNVEVKIKTDGNVFVDENGISVTDAKEIICSTNVILSEKDTREFNLNFDSVFEQHSLTFKSFMDRVCFELDCPDYDECTDVRIKNIKAGKIDDKMQELYFHYGRYLMISSSVCGKLPPNLQGKWNGNITPPWKCDYHFDINLQMNEWLLESANLSEFALPLTDYMLKFIESGRKTAGNLWGCRGICLPLSSDVWAECTPESFGYAVWVGAAAWMAQPLWRHYIYTGDIDYLKNKAYKFLKEVALFYEDFLEEDENGIMQIMPSQSPENRFKGAGSLVSVGICTSSAIDVQLAYDALGYAVEAARILQIDFREADKWETLRNRLPKFAIGSDGRLMEWNEEFEEEQPGHKHLSHLYGLYPSDIFTPEARPDEYNAAVKSFDFRMAHESGYTGWSLAWISNIYARTGNAKGFYEQITGLLKDFATQSLLDIHPDPVSPGVKPDIFQIDGNFGMVSAVTEALCGYFDGKVHILYALPENWKNGRISGVKLPGGHEISFSWENAGLTNLEIVIGYSEKLIINISGKDIDIIGQKDEKIKII